MTDKLRVGLATRAPKPLCVIYTALSSADENDSRGSQLTACREYAKRQGWKVAGEYSDEAHSGYRKSRGTDLLTAKAHAAQLAAEGNEVYALAFAADRFARGDGKQARHLAQYWFEAQDAGYQLASVTEDIRDPVMAMLVGQRNTLDSKTKGAHVSRGKRAAAEKGRHNGGPRPLGYRPKVVGQVEGKSITDGLEKVPQEAAAIVQMFELTVAGLSQGQIARRINRTGLRTPPTKYHPEGCEVTQTRVSVWLRSRLYIGDVYRTETREDGTTFKHWFTGKHEGIVSIELFDRVQAILAGNRRGEVRNRGGRPGRFSWLLGGGLIRCGECGKAMRAHREVSTAGRVIEVYRCDGRASGAAADCTMKRESRAALEGAVWSVFELIGLDTEASVARARISSDLARETLRAQVVEQEAKLATTAAALDKADADFAKMSTAVYNRLATKLAAQIKQAEADLTTLRTEEAGAAVNEIFDDAEGNLREQMELIRRSIAAARTDEGCIPEARAAIQTVFHHFVLHRRDKPLFGISTWLEPVPHAEAIAVKPTGKNPAYFGGSNGELRKAVLAPQKPTRREP